MLRRFCNRCGSELRGNLATGEHIIYDCWEVQNAEGYLQKQDEYDLCKTCYKKFRKFMKGKLEE